MKHNQNTACANCGEILQGQFCHRCGQNTDRDIGFFRDMLSAWLSSVLGYESRIQRTLPRLMFIPGAVGADYIGGKRARHIDPFRLYLFCSVLFFLLSSGLSSPIVSFDDDAQAPGNESLSEQSTVEQSKSEQSTDESSDTTVIDFDLELENFAELSLPEWAKERLRPREISIDQHDRQQFSELFMERLPQALFTLVPGLAILLKVLYWRRRQYFAEHMITALYSHSALFIFATLILLFNQLHNSPLMQGSWPRLASLSDTLGSLVVAWIPVYLFLHHRRAYPDRKLLLIPKFLLVALAYLTLYVAALVSVVILSAFLLDK